MTDLSLGLLDLALLGVDPNQPYMGDMVGATPLMTAATKGSVGVIRALVECGANVEATDTRGGTALLFAAGSRTGPSARRAAAIRELPSDCVP